MALSNETIIFLFIYKTLICKFSSKLCFIFISFYTSFCLCSVATCSYKNISKRVIVVCFGRLPN